MALTKEFIEAVENGKKTRIRIMLKDTMLVDPSLKAFEDMLTYAERHIVNLYDKHDGEVLNNDAMAWNEDYLNQQMVSVVTNFSKERVSLLKKIVKKLYAAEIQTEAKLKSSPKRSQSLSTSSNSKNDLSGTQIVGGVIAIVGGVVLVGGIVSSSASVAIAGGVALAGGIVMTTLDGNKEV